MATSAESILFKIQPERVKILPKKMLFYADYYTRVYTMARVIHLMFMRVLDPRTILSIPMLSLA